MTNDEKSPDKMPESVANVLKIGVDFLDKAGDSITSEQRESINRVINRLSYATLTGMRRAVQFFNSEAKLSISKRLDALQDDVKTTAWNLFIDAILHI